MQVTKEGIERIKAANDLAAVAAERGLDVKRKGRQLVASCPFHQERTASFTLSPGKGLYHCFGCGAAGDVIGFVTKHDRVSFREALETLARRAGLDLGRLMEPCPRMLQRTPLQALTPPPREKDTAEGAPLDGAPPTAALSQVVDHYHRTFCQREDAQAYLKQRGLTDLDLLRALKVGYADGSLLKAIPKDGDLRQQLVTLGVVTPEGRELLGGCVVVPIPDPVSGAWTNLYGRGLRTPRHCYLPGPLRGVLNFQAARSSSEVILTESILDALSFHQAGIATAIPIYGTNGFTADHLDLLKRERVERVVLALDSDEPGRKATDALKEKLTAAGIAVRTACFPPGIKDANELLTSRNGDAGEAFRALLDGPASPPANGTGLLDRDLVSPAEAAVAGAIREGEHLVLRREERTYRAKAYPPALGRLRATVKLESGPAFHVDTLDLYASRSRAEFARRAGKALSVEASTVEADLLALLVEVERTTESEKVESGTPMPLPLTGAERAEALALLRRGDLLDQVAADVDALGYVGEETNKRLLYLVAISRKLPDPLSAVILSQSGAGKSGLTEVIERLTPPEDVVLLTRLTPQSLYYTPPGFLDQKLVIVEERCGSIEADYSIRVLQSRKKLIAAAPVKDPTTGSMRTKVFTVEARAAFIEATTASSVNHENATRCFELTMDESVEQTRRIHERQRLLRTERGLELRRQAETIVRRHWNAQRLLAPAPVLIPYADRLTFPSAWMRTRRDHARFLNLIEVSAFLHQHQRERRGEAIVAALEDYALAYALAGQVLQETLSDVRKPLREAFERIRDLSLKSEGTVSRREIREALAVPDSTVRRWLNDLAELEYVSVLDPSKAGQGKTARYRVLEHEPRPTELAGLLSPEELRRRMEPTSPPRHTPPNGGGDLSVRP
jgi:5S rRNA maturation endonuclease (ribonuclease M5)